MTKVLKIMQLQHFWGLRAEYTKARRTQIVYMATNRKIFPLQTLTMLRNFQILSREDGIILQMDNIARKRTSASHQPSQIQFIHTNAGLIFRRSEEHTSELQSRENLVCR